MGTVETYRQFEKSLGDDWQVLPSQHSRVGMLKEILNWLGHPERRLSVIHIVGSNGKGSTGVMLSKILTTAGYRVGHFSTPAILSDREVVMINGQMISEKEVMFHYKRIMTEIKNHGGDEKTLTKFEMWTLIALCHFAKQEVHFAIIEAGLGGTGDTTNVVEKPLIVAITKISDDHSTMLGHNVLKIAENVAGAIKPGSLVVNYPGQDVEVFKTLRDKATAVGAVWNPYPKPQITLMRSSPEGLIVNADQLEGLKLSLTGAYQANNLSTVLQVVTILKNKRITLSDVTVAEALAHVKITGRMEFDSTHNILYDGAHNPHGISSLVAAIRSWHLPFKPIVILGLIKGKNHMDMLDELLPYVSTIIAVTPDAKNAMSADELAAKIVMMSNVDVEIADDSTAAISLARQVRESSKSLIVVTGSFYTLRAIEKEDGI
ncbi:bifunctional folylpolyglutamate synthase/dihydrofolate synthase [Weissella fangxianensis]|uniref:bifunctional folylpolyglutamate synthase/dihydrofolate synthase n=1 Tax=Weissella fangxianensis TaxID=2953879 RepID=UPI0021571A9F|nr:cyanophycin synthetase [Weissella fangxianensis]